MRDHIKILGILNIVLGSFSALAGVVVFLLTTGAAGAIAAGMRSTDNPDFPSGVAAAPIVATIGIIVGAFLILISLPSIIGGWGLMRYRPWSRTLMLIVSGFHLFSIPFGTALGIYGFWVLLNRESEGLLASGGMFNAAAPVGAGYPAPSSFAPNPNYVNVNPSAATYQPPETPSTDR